MFKLTPEGRQRVDGNDVVRQTVPEFGSSNRESPTANSRQYATAISPADRDCVDSGV